MEKMVFKTLVKAEHKLGCDNYVLGRISGIQYVVCDRVGTETEQPLYGRGFTALGSIFKTKCTAEQYDEFASIVESEYPELCVFNYAD